MGRLGKETLPSLHRKKLEEIKEQEATLPELKAELKSLEESLEKSLTDGTQTERQITLNIEELKDKIKHIESMRADYYVNNGELLFKFAECERTAPYKVYDMSALSSKRAGFKAKADVTEKTRYYQQYLSNIDPDYVPVAESPINEENYCYKCDAFRVLHADLAIMVCETCAAQTTAITNPEKPSMKDPPTESHYYQYKRFSHFEDCLANVQGRESKKVPQEVIDTIILEIRKVRMEHRVDELDEEDIKEFLKKHRDKKYDVYYDHATQILYKITEIEPIQMTPEMEENLKIMFAEIQEPFEMFKNKRRNFSSYSYILYKCCQLLGYVEFLPKLKLHKNYQKLYEHDMIWKKICQYMGGEEKGWKFIKSYDY